jgi:hypothetical protein
MKLMSKQTDSNIAQQVSAAAEEQVRSRAFELYEQRGRADGHDLQDWLQAESEITSNKREELAA